MSAKTQYLSDEILKWLTGQANALGTPLANLYVGIFTALAADGAAGTEAAGNGYARKQITPAQWAAIEAGTGNARRIPNGSVVQFAQITAEITVVGYGIWDAATDGNLLYSKTTASVTYPANNEIKFPISALAIQED